MSEAVETLTTTEDVAAALVVLLEKPWRVEQRGSAVYVTLGTGNAAPSVMLGQDQRRKRIYARGIYPRDGQRYMSPRDWGAIAWSEKAAPEASCSAERPAAKIATEIMRRLVPEYLRIHAACVAKLTDYDTSRKNARALALELASLLDVGAPREEDGGHSWRIHWSPEDQGSGELVCRDGSVEINLRRLSPAKARAIAFILNSDD